MRNSSQLRMPNVVIGTLNLMKNRVTYQPSTHHFADTIFFNMISHINNICSSSFYYLYNLRRIRKYLSRQSAISLIHAFITSKLDYCNSLLYGLPPIYNNKLQRVQNAAARLVTNTPRICHITAILKDLHWLPIKYRIQFKIVLLTFKCLYGFAPQ